MTRLAGIVLAGGRSSRMGRDKALLRLNGVTLLDRAIATLRAAGADTVVVAGERPGGAGVPDRMAGRGPLAGLDAALARCHDGHVLVLAVDMPGVTVADLTALTNALDTAPAACFAGHPLPWAARVDTGLRDRVAELLAGEPRRASMQALHRAYDGVELPAGATTDLRNVNTPDDWAAFVGATR